MQFRKEQIGAGCRSAGSLSETAWGEMPHDDSCADGDVAGRRSCVGRRGHGVGRAARRPDVRGLRGDEQRGSRLRQRA